MAGSPVTKNSVSIVLAGAAGQGIQTVEVLLTKILKLSGYNFFATKEYMSRVRGGSNSTEIRISSSRVRAYTDHIDFLFPLTKESLAHVSHRLSADTLIIGEKEKLTGDDDSGYNIYNISFTSLAEEIGNKLFSNIIAVGVICGMLGLEREVIVSYLRNYFSRKGEEITQKNALAVEKGYEIGIKMVQEYTVNIEIKPQSYVKDDIVLNGAEAVGTGALLGGCQFISTYPMSPSTAVLVFLAGQSKEFDIVAEQAEDEIAGINMALGASYAGARALVSTSGGGYALMTEGTSLAAMIETPIVIHIAQRPGPATGLPTRTEQGDLELALYAGHGEYPRVIYAPGSIEDAVFLTQRAFNTADKYQVPVFVLTDQYFIDSYYNLEKIDAASVENEYCIVETDKKYRRYALTEDGISPRGVPGHGTGLVAVDSDEHDEAGHITEDLGIRVDMMDKRLKKFDALRQTAIPPECVGPHDNKNIIVCWGSTYHIVCEAVEKIGREDISVLYFKQVFPFSPYVAGYFKNAAKTILIENNATSQFGKVLKLYADIDIETKILKYNGMPFSVEELVEKIQSAL